MAHQYASDHVRESFTGMRMTGTEADVSEVLWGWKQVSRDSHEDEKGT